MGLDMGDVEGDDVAAAPVASGPMDINKAIAEVLKQALIANGLARGLREAAKSLDKRQALLCVLSENCDEPMYKKLVTALCMEHNIPLIKVDSNMKLGEWVGLCKFVLVVKLAQADPFTQLHVGVNLDKWDVVLHAEGGDQILVHGLVTVLREAAKQGLPLVQSLGGLPETSPM